MTYNQDNIEFSPKPTVHNFLDLTGKVVERLTVLGYAGKRGRRTMWWCECQCGNIKKISTDHLKPKRTRSCGCLQKEIMHQIRTTHGETLTKQRNVEYISFHHAKGRCQNPNNKAYPDYGGRGIEFRLKSIQELLKDIGRRPSPTHQLDRIDNEGHYEVGNIRWATKLQQMSNTRQNIWLTVNGQTQCAIEWASVSPVKASVIRKRKHRGWCDECAVLQPFQGQCSHAVTSITGAATISIST